jgi:hypothetical protein
MQLDHFLWYNRVASKLLIVSNVKMDAKLESRNDEDIHKTRKKNPSKTQERECVHCGDICKEVERAKDWPGRVGCKSCPHRMAAC